MTMVRPPWCGFPCSFGFWTSSGVFDRVGGAAAAVTFHRIAPPCFCQSVSAAKITMSTGTSWFYIPLSLSGVCVCAWCVCMRVSVLSFPIFCTYAGCTLRYSLRWAWQAGVWHESQGSHTQEEKMQNRVLHTFVPFTFLPSFLASFLSSFDPSLGGACLNSCRGSDLETAPFFLSSSLSSALYSPLLSGFCARWIPILRDSNSRSAVL